MGGRASRPAQQPAAKPKQRKQSSCCSGLLSFGRGGKATSSARSAAAAPSSASLPDDSGLTRGPDEGHTILRAILAIEQRCLQHGSSPEAKASGEVVDEGLEVECMLDEEEKRFFLCSSLSSPIVIAYFWLRFRDVRLEDLRLALTDCKERQQRDSDSEYQELRKADEGDPTHCEDVAYLLRSPWPFSDREILQRRWQLPIGDKGEGLAIVMRSFVDAALYPGRQDRVRATLQKAAYILRPVDAPRGAEALGLAAAAEVRQKQPQGDDWVGPAEACWQPQDVSELELVVCQQIDLGGLCPSWAQRFLTRFAVQASVEWSRKVRDHCIMMNRRRAGLGDDEENTTGPPAQRVRGASKPRAMTGQEVLEAILAIERRCCSSGDGAAEQGFPITPPESPRKGHAPADATAESRAVYEAAKAAAGKLVVECLLDEPTAKYCLCGSLDSPVVIGYIRVLLADVYPGDVWRALVATEERLLRDPASEYQVLRKAENGDQTCQEDISFVWRAPWPFWDRDILQRRWTFPLREGEGMAIVMRSIEDESLLPVREDRVRAFVHKCGYLLRPLERSRREQLAQGESAWNSGAGLELTVCQQVDLGGLCPDWAQEVLTRWAVNRGLQWAEELREHCRQQHWLRSEKAGEPEPALA